ncbi:MAG: NnrUfamily protein [Hyphomicrobiales bacterium]|nr:NnrUfamily protein [Hyphomicrobiales bacterium]
MLLIIGLILFLGVHIVPTFPMARANLRMRLGENGYKGLFGVVSLLGFVLIVIGFGAARMAPWNTVLWSPPVWTKHIAFALMLPAFILLVATYIPSRIRDRAKHPMLAAVKIWALAHLIANGDLAGVILFASFLAYGVYDRISVKRRGALGPLGAKRGGVVNDILVVVIGVLLYAFMLIKGHAWLIGVPLLRM